MKDPCFVLANKPNAAVSSTKKRQPTFSWNLRVVAFTFYLPSYIRTSRPFFTIEQCAHAMKIFL